MKLDKKMIFFYITVFIGLLAFDQWSKSFMESKLALYQSVEIIPGFFYFTHARNTGAAWSLLEGQMLFFYAITIIAFIAICYYFRQTKDYEKFTRLGLVMIASGTIGNFIDRLLFQYVRDFLDFIIFGYDFPIFNIADSAICIGVAFIILEIVIEEYKGWKLSKSS